MFISPQSLLSALSAGPGSLERLHYLSELSVVISENVSAHLKRVNVVGTELLAGPDVGGCSHLLAGGGAPQPAPHHVGRAGVVDPANKENKPTGDSAIASSCSCSCFKQTAVI